MTKNPTSFDRRLRLLIAREFASRGYYLDAESFFERVGLTELNSDELALLVVCAAGAKSQASFDSRLERLKKIDATAAQQLRDSLAASIPPTTPSHFKRAFGFVRDVAAKLKRAKKACS